MICRFQFEPSDHMAKGSGGLENDVRESQLAEDTARDSMHLRRNTLAVTIESGCRKLRRYSSKKLGARNCLLIKKNWNYLYAGDSSRVPGVPAGRRLRLLLPPEFAGVAASCRESWLGWSPTLLHWSPLPGESAAGEFFCKVITTALVIGCISSQPPLSRRICAACAWSWWAVMEVHISSDSPPTPVKFFAAFDLL